MHCRRLFPSAFALCVSLAFISLSPVMAHGDLLQTKAISETVLQYDTAPIDSVDFKIFLQDNLGSMASVPVFEQTFSEADAGTTLVFDSGPIFDQAADLLTNGVDDFVTVFVGPMSQTFNESAFFSLTPDFYGNQITSVVANLDTIQITPMGQVYSTYVAQVDFSGSLEIHGQSMPEPNGLLLAAISILGVLAAFPLSYRWRS